MTSQAAALNLVIITTLNSPSLKAIRTDQP